MSKPKKTILITAGPTIELIDPIRYLSNYSTGRMGFELAKAAKKRNYRVILISGPTPLTIPKGVRFISIKTALDMKKEVFKFFKHADCVIMAAAVSDFRPASFSVKKIKKLSKKTFSLKLKRNPDILASLGKKKDGRILVGYSLETARPIENAKKKLKLKNLDIIVVNRIGKKLNPFGLGAKDIAIIDRKGNIQKLSGVPKTKIASYLLDKIESIKQDQGADSA
jgi:phosphopantothenoylcysteine decarboxylase/phosphopantothenate--cysteine ligase